VGESSRNETGITVTGLKPGHFYNARVIAVGNNNFQAGSQVIRLKTYGRDGRSETGSVRGTSLLVAEESQNGHLADSSDESTGARRHGAGVEAIETAENNHAASRESNNVQVTPRRNTLARKHSPSTASEHPTANPVGDHEESMLELTERLEAVRTETEEVVAQISKDAEDFRLQMIELARDRDEKKQALKEKEDASEKLRKEVHLSERSNRQAQNRKTAKEKTLRDKQAERAKMQDDITRWDDEIQQMRSEMESMDKEKEELEKVKETKLEAIREVLRQQQATLNNMEEEIRVKGLKIKDLEEERQRLPVAQDDEQSKARDNAEMLKDMEWEAKERELLASYNAGLVLNRTLKVQFEQVQAMYNQMSARQAINTAMYHHGNASGVDYDNGMSRTRSRRGRQRKSRTSTVSSPINAYPNTDSAFSGPSTYANMTAIAPTFAQGPYFDLNATTGMSQLPENSVMDEADIRSLTGGAPLSPTAAALLPSNIFADDEPPSPRADAHFPSLGPSISHEDDQQSPPTSCSPSLISSPQASSHNLSAFPTVPEYAEEADRPSGEFGAIGTMPPSTNTQLPPARRFGDLFRQRGKTLKEDGLAFGTLKSGQSQSFPRHSDESEAPGYKNRRTSFSTAFSGLPFLNRGVSGEQIPESSGLAHSRNVATRRRGFNMFSSSTENDTSIYSNRNPSSPRPASIASSEFPRPSTDSAPFGWPAVDGAFANKNSPLATNWSLNLGQGPWSRATSRRPSIQHGSTSNLVSSIATEEDEFLPTASPPPVGVIGTRPQSSTSVTPKLNPAAPTFKAMFGLGSKSDKSEKTKGKGKDKDKTTSDATPESSLYDEGSPTESRKSRDTRSIHTQSDSIAESQDSLDRTASNTPSDLASSAGKDKENSFRQLLRKGSSSKFFRSKEAIFGSSKKGSDRNASGDRSSNFEEFDETGEDERLGRGFDSVTSSPQPGGSTPKEGRRSVNWGRFTKKVKGAATSRTSMEAGERDKDRASETEGTEDEESLLS
jgi:hypothetical protein